MDLRGQGRSAAPPPPYTIALFAADVACVLDALLGDDAQHAPHVLGWSLGAAVAMQLAADYPARVRSLCLFGFTAHFTCTEAMPSVASRA